MRKIILGLALALSLGMYACSSDGGGQAATDPTNVDFTSPTGTLTADNANEVGQSAINTSNSSGAGFGGIPTALSSANQSLTHAQTDGFDELACFEDFANSANETSFTLDLECFLSIENSGCTGSGDIEIQANTGYTSWNYNNAAMNCGNNDVTNINGGYSFVNDASVYCTNLTYTVNGMDEAFNGCYNSAGDLLLTVDGNTFTVSNLSISCSEVSFDVTDASTTNTMTCDPVSVGSCNSSDDVYTVENCTF